LKKNESVFEKKMITVYFGNFYSKGIVEFDSEDRIVLSCDSGESTVIWKSFISAITIHDSDANVKKKEDGNSNDIPFILAGKKRRNRQDNHLNLPVSEDSQNTNDVGMYIPTSVLTQDPEMMNIYHDDDFSTSFAGTAKIDFTSEE